MDGNSLLMMTVLTAYVVCGERLFTLSRPIYDQQRRV